MPSLRPDGILPFQINAEKWSFAKQINRREKKKASLIIPTFLRNISKNTYWPYPEWKVSEGALEVFYFSLA